MTLIFMAKPLLRPNIYVLTALAQGAPTLAAMLSQAAKIIAVKELLRPDFRVADGEKGSQRLDDALRHLLGVAEQHHRVVTIEQRVVDAGIARGERALDEHHGAGLPHLQHRHAVDWRRLVFLGRRVGYVV